MLQMTRFSALRSVAAPIVMIAAVSNQPYPTCLPIDEGPRRADFVTFRTELKAIIARRDAAALLRIVDPHIKSSFGGDDDLDAFVRWWHPDDPKSELWNELGSVVEQGGAFHQDDWFEAPYVAATCSPAGYDAFEYVALVGSGVRVRAAPHPQARVLATLSYAVLRLNRADDRGEGWTAVKLAGDRAGFVDSKLARSPVGYRAHFRFIDHEWRLTIFLAGD
jgi:hypothetical protein